MKTAIKTLASLVALSPLANAELVGLNFQGNGAANLASGTVAGDTAGTIFPQANWNNAGNGNNNLGTIANLTSSTGASSGIAASWLGPDSWSASGAVGASGNAEMSYGFIKSNNGSTQIPSGNVTVTFSNLTPGTLFDMIIYTATDNASPTGTFSLNNTTNTSVSYAVGAGNVATFTEDSTKHTFSNLTATGSSVTLTMSGNGAGLAGVQFSTIPEPSSMLLLGLGAPGGLGMVVRRARAKA